MKSFINSESGVISVEYVLWLPALTAILGLGLDTTILLIKQAQLYDMNHQVSRLLVTGDLVAADLDSTLQNLWPSSGTYTAEITDDPDYLVLSISVPFREVMMIGRLLPAEQKLSSRVVMAKEQG